MRPFYLLSLVFASACIMPPAGGSSGPTYAGGNNGYSGGGGSTSAPESMPASQPAAMTTNAAPAGPVYVSIRSSCPQTVKVFYGEKPKFGSGTYSSIESNSIESHSFQPGEMMWIVDESENGIASTSISPSTRELEIGSGCSSIMAR